MNIFFKRKLSTAVGTVLAVVIAASAQAESTTPAMPSMDPAVHDAHVAAGTHPAQAIATTGDPALAQQLSELRVKFAELDAALAKNAPLPTSASTPSAAMPGMAAPATAAAAMPAMAAPVAPMAGMSGAAPGAMKPAGGMSGMAAAPGGAANMKGMMDKMMGMMDKMMSMGGASVPMPTGGGMEMDTMKMAGGASMPAAPAVGMSGGGGMDKMKMAGMMGMGAMSSGAPVSMPQSALPGYPGASHLYHIGATGFFLDHPQHITLTTEQQAGLNMAKEHALLAKSTADRAVEQAEQALWMLTDSDQPDATQIEAKVTEIEKLRGDERLSFIRAVGDASKFLTDEQRKSLTGFAMPAAAAPTAAPMAVGMKGM